MRILKKYRKSYQLVALFFVLILIAQSVVPSLSQHANAAALASGTVRFDRMNASQATTGTVCATTNATVQTEAAVAVTFPTGYTLGAFGTWGVGTSHPGTDWPAGAAAWVGITAPSASNQINGQTVQFTSGDLAANTLYCFNWTNSAALSIKAGATASNTGVITTCSNSTDCASTGSGGGTSGNLDTVTYATASVNNNCGSGAQACDQIQVTGSIGTVFSFSLSATTAGLGALTSANPVSATPVNAIVGTNAHGGWQIWAADLGGVNAGLHSSTAPKTIAYSPAAGSAAAALTNGNEGYNLGVGTAGVGTCNSVTNDGNFDSTGTPFKGGGLDGTMRSLASSTGIANNCQLPLTMSASISGTTPAATDYSGTITVVAAGNF